jgi:ABC-type sugar transport system substrate-binding protein
MKVKKLLILAGFLFLAVSMVFAGGGKAKTQSGDGKFNITFVTPLVAHPIWDVAREGFEAAAAEFGFNDSYVGPQGIDPAEMVNQIEIALASGADAIITMPIAPEAMRPVIQKCADQGVPVVFAGAEDDLSKSLAFVGTNEEELGRLGARALMDKFAGKPIKAHILMSTLDASFAIKARDGYLKAFESYPGDFQMVLYEPCNSDMMIAMERYQNALAAHPEINCLIGVCGEAGPAAAKVVNELGRNDIVIMAIDDTQEALDYVKGGVIYGTMAQNFYKIGYEPARILYEYLKNGTPPASYKNDSGCIFVNKDNINTYMASLKK